MYVCLCLGVTDRQIQKTIANGASSVEEIMDCTGAGTRCGSCRSSLASMVGKEDEAPRPTRCRLPVLTPATNAA